MRTSAYLTHRTALLALGVALVPAPPAHALETIPAFARKYGMSCSVCHTAAPKLTEFGETFAGHGFRMSPNEAPRDTIGTGDQLLQLAQRLPLAVRLDAYVQGYMNGDVESDLQAPYNVKILSGGPIAENISYYFYFFLFERGEVGGVEDAFVYVNDLFGIPVDVAIGQFQVSDPLFKRELRLEFQDYAIYRARVGDQPTDLTYDRGIVVAADLAGFTVTGQLVNGNGRGEAEPNRRLDNDPFKNGMLHVSRSIVPGIRLGAMGYYGRQRGATDGSPTASNRVRMIGGDATLSAGPLEINGQYLVREDERPTFTLNELAAVTKGGFVEAIVHPRGARWYALALYNRIDANRPLLNVRLGGPSDILRYETISAGGGYLLRTNVRFMAEFTRDLELDVNRVTLGLTTAF
jgi:hypothetical protein